MKGISLEYISYNMIGEKKIPFTLLGSVAGPCESNW